MNTDYFKKIRQLLSFYKFHRYFAIIILIYQIIELTDDYLKYKTVFDMKFKRLNKREFPEVTVCFDDENQYYNSTKNYMQFSLHRKYSMITFHYYNKRELTFNMAIKYLNVVFRLNPTYEILQWNNSNYIHNNILINRVYVK